MDSEGDDATTVKEWQRRRWSVAAPSGVGAAAETKANTVASRSVDSKQVCEYAIIAIAQLLAFVDCRP